MASGFLNDNILKLDYDTKTQDFLIMQKHLKDILNSLAGHLQQERNYNELSLCRQEGKDLTS